MSEIEDVARKIFAVFTSPELEWKDFEAKTEKVRRAWPELFDALQDLVDVVDDVNYDPKQNLTTSVHALLTQFDREQRHARRKQQQHAERVTRERGNDAEA